LLPYSVQDISLTSFLVIEYQLSFKVSHYTQSVHTVLHSLPVSGKLELSDRQRG